jgi:hypothetical protein
LLAAGTEELATAAGLLVEVLSALATTGLGKKVALWPL